MSPANVRRPRFNQHGLRTQTSEIEAAVGSVGGAIVGWYGGQEHAKSMEGLDTFKRHKVRFFIGAGEQDLFNPECRLFLGMTAVMGQFFAHNQVKKSVTNRANRAKRGRPACGRLPFGRTFDKATETWGIDPAKQAFIARVAERYLAGESLRDIAKEAGVNYPNLHKTLLHRCGEAWAQNFKCPDMNVDVETVTAVPRLLGEETVRALAERTHANKTYNHGCLRHAYLLSRMVFCAECGYAMDGQFAAVCGRRYYRHTYAETLRPCPLPHPRGTVRADGLEDAVMRLLFELFGNPAAVARAMERATPDAVAVAAARQRLEAVAGEEAAVEASRQRVIKFIAKGTITEADADSQLEELKARGAALHAERGRLGASVADAPTPARIRGVADAVTKAFRRYTDARLVATVSDANRDLGGMAWDDKRALVEAVFGGTSPDGRRLGVYLSRGGKDSPWTFRVRGHLIDAVGTLGEGDAGLVFGAPPKQRQLLANSASSSPHRRTAQLSGSRRRLRGVGEQQARQADARNRAGERGGEVDREELDVARDDGGGERPRRVHRRPADRPREHRLQADGAADRHADQR